MEFGNRISFYDCDILESGALQSVLATERPEIVFHLAAMHFIPWCNQHPQETIRVNVEGSYTVLTEAVRAGVRMCVLASTGAIYPLCNEGLSESLSAAPSDVYALSKHLMEETARAIANNSSMSCVVARLFNVYGPHETNQHLIPDILSCLGAGSVLRLGNVDTRRDYVYVDDAAGMLLGIALRASDRFAAVNIGTGDEYSAKEIISIIEQINNVTLELEIDPKKIRTTDRLHQRADTTVLEKMVGDRPRISISQGIYRLLKHEGLLYIGPTGTS